jgi:hypothetical protein
MDGPDEHGVRRATNEEFAEAFADAKDALRERPALTDEEKAAGWREDALSGLWFNIFTGEQDDSLFVFASPSSMGYGRERAS